MFYRDIYEAHQNYIVTTVVVMAGLDGIMAEPAGVVRIIKVAPDMNEAAEAADMVALVTVAKETDTNSTLLSINKDRAKGVVATELSW